MNSCGCFSSLLVGLQREGYGNTAMLALAGGHLVTVMEKHNL